MEQQVRWLMCGAGVNCPRLVQAATAGGLERWEGLCNC